MTELKQGDIVKLISGGQMMTVLEPVTNGDIFVVWHDTLGRMQRAVVSPGLLRKLEPKEPMPLTSVQRAYLEGKDYVEALPPNTPWPSSSPYPAGSDENIAWWRGVHG